MGKPSDEGGQGPVVDVVVPARNQAARLPALLGAVARCGVRHVVVVDAGSTDGTGRAAEGAGAIVLYEPEPGVGAACVRGLRHLQALPVRPDAVVFFPGDGTIDPPEIARLLVPLRQGTADLVVAARRAAARADGALPVAARVGNRVATGLICAIYGHRYSDVALFRAIRYPALVALGLRERGDGFLVEMQVRAIKIGLRALEVPVDVRARADEPGGRPSLRRRVGAGTRVVYTILRHAAAR